MMTMEMFEVAKTTEGRYILTAKLEGKDYSCKSIKEVVNLIDNLLRENVNNVVLDLDGNVISYVDQG